MTKATRPRILILPTLGPTSVRWMIVRVLPLLAIVLLLANGCSDEGAPAAAPPSPTPANAEPLASLASSPSPSPSPSPTPSPTATPSPAHTPEPAPTFSPGSAILPTMVASTPTPMPNAEDTLSRRLDAIGLRINVLRELSSTRPIDREFITREQLAVNLRQLFDEDLDEFDKQQRLYTTLGILDEGVDLYELHLGLYGEGVLGYYDDEVEKFYVVQDSEEFSPADERTYAHEFVHDLQQQHFDLYSTRKSLEGNSDGGQAFRALYEGDALVAELLYLTNRMDAEEQQASQTEPSEELTQAFLEAPHVIQRTYILAFQEGLQFVAELYRSGGWDSVNDAFTELPQSMEQIIHPDKYASGEQPVQVEVPDLIESLGQGWALVTEDTIGEFLLQAYMETDFSPQKAFDAADGWGGDRFRLFKGPLGGHLLVISIVWDTEDDAQEFFDTFKEFTESRTGGEWITPGSEGSPARMILPEQTIQMSIDMLSTLLMFAPDQQTLDTVSEALERESAPAE